MQSIKVQRRRRVKVFDETFFKKFRPETGAAGGKKQGNARTRPQGDRARPGLCATPRGGHTSPLFWSMGRRWLRPRTPVRSWGFTPNPTTFEKVDETFTRLRRGRALAVSTGAAVAAGLGCRLGWCLTVPTGHQHPKARIESAGTAPVKSPTAGAGSPPALPSPCRTAARLSQPLASAPPPCAAALPLKILCSCPPQSSPCLEWR